MQLWEGTVAHLVSHKSTSACGAWVRIQGHVEPGSGFGGPKVVQKEPAWLTKAPPPTRHPGRSPEPLPSVEHPGPHIMGAFVPTEEEP